MIDEVSIFMTIGGFVGMVAVGQVLWLDLFSLGSMLKTSENHLVVSLVLGGAMIAGAVTGATIGLFRVRGRQEWQGSK